MRSSDLPKNHTFRKEVILALLLVILTLLEAAVFITVFYHLSSKNLAISIQNVQLGTLGNMYMSIQDIDLRTDNIRTIHRDHDDDKNHMTIISNMNAIAPIRAVEWG